jgi:hypothetical protein
MEKTIAEQLSDIKAELGTLTKEEIKSALDKVEKEIKSIENKADKTELKSLTDAVDAIKTTLEESKAWQVKKDEADQKNQDALNKLATESKRKGVGTNGSEEKSFNQILGEAIEKNADRISGFGKGQPEVKIDLMPEHKEAGKDGKREVKAVGDMSISANFSSANTFFQDRRPLIQVPYNRVYLGDILPGGTSNGTSIIYPKENGGEGAAAVWEDPSQDKAQMDWDLTTQTVYFKWIAGIVIVDREMLDDIPFMTSYIQNKMLISLKTAENSFILNGTNASNPVTGLLSAASSYDGSFSADVDKLVDAAYGQIVEDTNEFYQGTTLVLRPRDAVHIGLNKASGSGEYNLPEGSAAFGNGNLSLAGIDKVTTTSLDQGNFLVFDKSAVMFIKRMIPELRLFEDSALAKRNKVMFRIEERATLATFNNSAIVKGTLSTVGS